VNDDDFDPYFVSPDVPSIVGRAQTSAIEAVDRQLKADEEHRNRLASQRGEPGMSANQLLKHLEEEQKRVMEKAQRALQAVEQRQPTKPVAEQEKTTDGSPKRRFPKPILD